MAPKFPAIAWRGLFDEYRQLVSPTTEAPDPFHWAAFAATFSALLGRGTYLTWGDENMPSLTHVGILGETGKSRKTTAINAVLNTVVDHFKPMVPPEASMRDKNEPDPFVVIRGSGSGEGWIEMIADRKWKHSVQKVEYVQKSRAALFVVSEFSMLLGKIKRGQAGSMEDFLLNSYDAMSEWVHVTKGKAVVATGATAGLLVATTFDGFKRVMSDEMVSAGLANRILWIAGDRKDLISFRPPVDQVKLGLFRVHMERCLRACWNQRFTATAAAQQVHDALYRREGNVPSQGRAADEASNRMTTHALRIALLFAAAEGKTVIDLPHIEAAWAVAAYGKSVVTEIVDQLRATDDREVETRILDAIRREVETTKVIHFRKRDIHRHVMGRNGMPATSFNKGWESLVVAGVLVQSVGLGGRFHVED